MPINTPLFAPETRSEAPRASAVDGCVRVLRDAIVSGELPPGLRLPPERALAERFEVNRVTVRTALARLEAEHLLSVRQGSGYAVRDFRRVGGPDLIATLATLARTARDRAVIIRDLLAVRRQLARALLERLMEQATAASLQDVDAAIDRFEAAAKSNETMEELATHDLEVVAALLAASESAVLQLCWNPVATLLRELPMLQAAMYRDPASNVAAFRALLALVRAGDRKGIDVALKLLEERDAATVEEIEHAKPQVRVTIRMKRGRR